jgi:hypothetical protein
VATALAGFEPVREDPTVVAFRPSSRRRSVLVGAGMAAALVAAVLVVPQALTTSTPHSAASKAAATTTPGRLAQIPDTNATAGMAAPQSATPGPGLTPLGDLGTVGSAVELQRRLAAVAGFVPEGSDAGTTGLSSTASQSFSNAVPETVPAACLDRADGASSLGSGAAPVLAYTADYQGTPAFVVLVAASSATGSRQAVVLSRAGCRILATTSI